MPSEDDLEYGDDSGFNEEAYEEEYGKDDLRWWGIDPMKAWAEEAAVDNLLDPGDWRE